MNSGFQGNLGQIHLKCKKKFSNAKSISSSQFFGDQNKAGDAAAEAILPKFSSLEDPMHYVHDLVAPGKLLSGRGTALARVNDMIFHVMKDGTFVTKVEVNVQIPRLHYVHPTYFETGNLWSLLLVEVTCHSASFDSATCPKMLKMGASGHGLVCLLQRFGLTFIGSSLKPSDGPLCLGNP